MEALPLLSQLNDKLDAFQEEISELLKNLEGMTEIIEDNFT